MKKIFNRHHTQHTPHLSFKIWAILVITISIIVLCIIGWNLLWKGTSIAVATDNNINITPTEIRSIKQIGQWEFLAINNEELIDTVRHGFFGDDELVRIYYGTLRLGIDLQEADKDFIQTKGDSILVILPPIKLLDHQFIDEGRTTSFFEKGNWTATDREHMYYRAYQAMINRCLTQQNIKSAERNANKQFTLLMKAMGYNNVIIKNKSDKK